MYYLDTGLGDENKDLYECTKNSEISLAFSVGGRFNDV